MVKKVQKSSKKSTAKAAAPAGIKDQAQQIWNAGLGALSKAKGDGAQAFEALMAEGAKLQKKTQAAAEETISAVSSKASKQFDKLESIFEERVAKALARLGVPTAKELAALSKRVAALEAPAKPAKAAAKPVVKKAAAKAPAKTVAKAAAKPAAKAPAKKAPAAKKAAAPARKKSAAKPAAAAPAAPAAQA